MTRTGVTVTLLHFCNILHVLRMVSTVQTCSHAQCANSNSQTPIKLWRQIVIILVSVNHNGIPSIKLKYFFKQFYNIRTLYLSGYFQFIYKSIHYSLLYFCDYVYGTGTPMRLQQNETKKQRKREEIPSSL